MFSIEMLLFGVYYIICAVRCTARHLNHYSGCQNVAVHRVRRIHRNILVGIMAHFGAWRRSHEHN